ncbi:prenylated Rab acceptor protein 1 [Episyrphus balteatus]|uniref:prenylated Rab acceptor protein 1 n=1 Tax=Episyrphus balteatus TaxID=286459 RepID=UPI0024865381|nr:prenylated Rab acceptor protein 1 [Episyrphus balteatus]
MDTKVDMSGDMNVPNQDSKSQIDFSSFTQFSKVPSIGELIQTIRQSIRPWSEFLHTQNFKTVASMPRLSTRFLRNLSYFQSNYILIFIILMIYCLITSPLVLIVLAASAYICHRVRKAATQFTVFDRTLTTKQQYIIISLASMPVLYLAGAGELMFWTLGASCFVISLHAIFYNIDAIVTEDTEGFLSEVV